MDKATMYLAFVVFVIFAKALQVSPFTHWPWLWVVAPLWLPALAVCVYAGILLWLLRTSE